MPPERHPCCLGSDVPEGDVDETKCAYDEISALSDNLDYHRAVEHLFVLTSAEIAPQERSFPLAAMAGLAAVVAVVVTVIFLSVWRQGGVEPFDDAPEIATVSTES